MTPTVIFVHGACVRDADWWWSQMTQPLTKRGISTVAVPLPSCGETGDRLGDLADDVEACRRAIAEVDGPIVLCGHSYGGMIITEAGADARVTRLIYVTSVMPDTGQSQAELIGAEPAPWLQPGEDTVGVDPEMIREYFLQDCDPATTEAAVARLTRQSLTPFTQAPVRSPGTPRRRPTSCAPKISPRHQRRSADAYAKEPGSSNSPPGTTPSSRGPTHSRKPSTRRSTTNRRQSAEESGAASSSPDRP